MAGGIVYPPLEAVLDAHQRLIDRYGGARGVRSPGGVEAALARAEQVRAYGDTEPTVFVLAAAIACGFVRIHHPFVDGNKRVAFWAAFATLRMNGWALDATERDAALVIERLAAGDLDEPAFAAWLERHAAPR